MKKKSLKKWWTEHKKIIPIVISAIIIAILGIFAHSILKKLNISSKELIKNLNIFSKHPIEKIKILIKKQLTKNPLTPDHLGTDINCTPKTPTNDFLNEIESKHEIEFKDVDVPEYTRNLPKGQKASPKKKKEAADRGISLEEDKTLVSSYRYKKKTETEHSLPPLEEKISDDENKKITNSKK